MYKNDIMTITERYIINTYSLLFENMTSLSKIELLQKLANSLKIENRADKNKDFFSSFGGLESDKSAEEIIKDIKESRSFNRKNLQL